MKPSSAIPLATPLRDVRLLVPLSHLEAATARRNGEHEAYERGRHDGEKALSEQLLQQRGELLELQQGVLDAMRAAVPQIIQQTEQQLLDVALEAARKVVAGLPISPELIEAVVREALTEVEDGAEITIHLHADDLALLRKHQSPVLKGLPETGPLRFVNSGEVARGGCLVQTRFGLLDARRETKLEQMRESLSA
jgi:flagellar assembly protein FliH